MNLTILAFGVGIFPRDVFFFPLGIAYVTYGIARTAVIGFLERGVDGEDGEDGEDEESAKPDAATGNAGPTLVRRDERGRRTKERE